MGNRVILGLLLGCIAAASARGQTPLGTAFTYQGQLKNAGSPATGLHDLRFRLFDVLAGGAQVGVTLCTENTSVADGFFTVPLDFGAQFAGQQRFLEIDVRADTGLSCADPTGFVTLTPRQALTAAPNAVFALNASTATTSTTATSAAQLNGQPAAFYQNATNLGAGTLNNLRLPIPLSLSGAVGGTGVIYGENSSTSFFPSGVYGKATATSGAVLGVTGVSASTEGTGVAGFATATSGNTIGVTGSSASTGGVGVFGDTSAVTGGTYGVRGRSASSAGRGVFGEAMGLLGVGVHGLSTSADGTGVSGWGKYGVTGGTPGTDGAIGVLGYSDVTSGLTRGVSGWCNSTSGIGVAGEAYSSTGPAFGVRGVSSSVGGRGVFGQATAATGATDGVFGKSSSASDNAVGVHGLADGPTGVTFGGRFECTSTSGIGVFGFNTASTGITYGVYGRSDSPAGFDFYAGGVGANYGAASSRRWKSDIEPIAQPLSKLGRLRGVYFNWDAEHGGCHDVGMIAEEVGAVLPEIVCYEENCIDAIGMDYSKMTPLLVQAVNALRAEKDAQIAEQQKTISALTARLERLEKVMSGTGGGD